MAFPQSDLTPSGTVKAVALTPTIGGILRRPAKSQRFLLRILAVLLAIMVFIVPGYLAARATESLAMGILAADLAFIVVIAGWSAVGGGGRRHR